MTLKASNHKKATPANVVKWVAAITLFCQLMPPIIESAEVLNVHAKNLISFLLDVVNVGAAVAAMFFGVTPNQKQ